MNFEDLKQKLLKDPEFKKEYENKDDAYFEISEMVEEARVKKGLTQEQLAKKIGTKQSSISRIENCSHLPSISFLQKIAKALGDRLILPKFASFGDTTVQTGEFFAYTKNVPNEAWVYVSPTSTDASYYNEIK